jgi:hypothetical protein
MGFGNTQAKANKGSQLEHLHPRLWPALYLKILEGSQSPHHLTDAEFCSVSLAPKVRKNRFRDKNGEPGSLHLIGFEFIGFALIS